MVGSDGTCERGGRRRTKRLNATGERPDACALPTLPSSLSRPGVSKNRSTAINYADDLLDILGAACYRCTAHRMDICLLSPHR